MTWNHKSYHATNSAIGHTEIRKLLKKAFDAPSKNTDEKEK